MEIKEQNEALVFEDMLAIHKGRNFIGDNISCQKKTEYKGGFSSICEIHSYQGDKLINEFDFEYLRGVTRIERLSGSDGLTVILASEIGLGAGCLPKEGCGG